LAQRKRAEVEPQGAQRINPARSQQPLQRTKADVHIHSVTNFAPTALRKVQVVHFAYNFLQSYEKSRNFAPI
jgi:hypothetical protein